MGNTLKEIKKVGLKDWLWFVVWLKRDEFSPKLSASSYTRHEDRLKLILRDRIRAHNIQMALSI